MIAYNMPTEVKEEDLVIFHIGFGMAWRLVNPPFSPNDSPMEKSSDTSTHNCSVPVRQSAR